MMIEYLSKKTRRILEDAVTQWINGDHQPMADLIEQIQRESHSEGYMFAIESLSGLSETISELQINKEGK